MVGTPSRVTRRSAMAETLMAAIGWGDLRPGVEYSAAGLGARFGHSTASADAALAGLVHDGLVARVPGGGYRLTEPSADELRELIELRVLIEVPTARQVAENGVGDRDLQRLRQLAAATVRPARAGDLIGYIRTDLEFHLGVLALAGNDQILEVVRVMRARSRIDTLRPVASEFMVANAVEHERMVDMIGSGDAAHLDALWRAHISRILEALP